MVDEGDSHDVHCDGIHPVIRRMKKKNNASEKIQPKNVPLTVRSLCSRDVSTKRKNMAENGRHIISATIAIYSNLNLFNGQEMSYVEWNLFKLHLRNGKTQINYKKNTNRVGSSFPNQLPSSFSLFLSTFQFNRMKQKRTELKG